jgi:hypothetical protein
MGDCGTHTLTKGGLKMSVSKNDKQAKPKKDAMRVGAMVEIRGAGKKKIAPYRPNRLRDGS